ncbi:MULTISPECIES: Na+/H+ antiporter subunit E [unclassified Pseudomonas]|jgi:multicomponent K+:H+ antiporter subunit E|uniref:Na+/H+ antiporter subunit E n=1 Tax=unclassified Pseudomonas TaxID=196821 RepID=UPI000C8439C6|nr:MULTISPECIES: Na+/H+ antiporter subunit E [unclassified Pseudomonas]MDX9669724.1 Na+/H+ antiporter subunit E [Pseudomonas sp. P8_250]PMQ09496.1 Na(+)/H(+) antiporter subunit E [Pseudomonas sp. AD21]WPN36247.1 Na+/H+ antiporter subunit E [Pseudomonas sp. P8_139]WPN41952.1 Na+/H+ antiporter subunit E [Pseudomonas sp. P8_229]
MKRVFPAPWLSLALWALWLTLNLSISPGNLLLGAILGFAAPLMMRKLRPKHARIRRPGTIIKLFLLVGRDVVLSNLVVAWGVLNAGRRPPRSRFVKVPLDLRDAHGLATLAMICTVVPGTVWSELALDRSILLLHVWDLDDEAQFIHHFKTAYERPLMEIFE